MTMVKQLGLLILIPDPSLRKSVVCYLSSMPDMNASAAISSAAQASTWSGDASIDMLLVDAEAPQLEEVGGIAALRLQFPGAKFVLIGDEPSPATLIEAMRAGVDGYLPRSTSLDGLARALRGIQNGEAALSRTYVGLLVRGLQAEPSLSSSKDGLADALPRLSPREAEVLACIRQGYSNEEIAQLLVVSLHTVKTHVSKILTKTGVRSRHQLAAAPASGVN